MSDRHAPVQPFPWDAAMRFGLGHLRLSPDQFWSMTPRELSMAVQSLGAVTDASMSKDQMQHLMSLFPDRPEQDGMKRE